MALELAGISSDSLDPHGGRIEKDKNGNIVEVYCTYDSKTRGGWSDDGRRVKGTLHWVSSEHAINASVNIYDHLFKIENPEVGGDDFINNININSHTIIDNVKLENSLKESKKGIAYQFLRNGYFCLDKNSSSKELIFNQTIGLREGWKKKN